MINTNGLLRVTGMKTMCIKTAVIMYILLSNLSRHPLSHILKSPKYRLVTRILIIALLAAGDIETQPGPTIGPLHAKRK